jgi:DNA-binding transcriptional LysR family regulator
VRIEVTTRVCADIRDSVAAGQSDLGLVLEVDAGQRDDSVLTKARLVICAAPSHPLTGRTALAEDLGRCDFYMSDAAGDYHQALRRHFETAELPQPRTQALGTVEGVKRGLLAGGAALGLLPAHAVTQELAQGLLAEVRTSPPMPGLVLRAVRGPDGADSPVAEELLRSLRGLVLA